MKKTAKILSIILALVMVLSAIPIATFAADPAAPEGYSIFVFYDGLSDEITDYESVTHEVIKESSYVIPENPDTVKEDLKFNGFYCTNTGKMVQIGESVPLTDFIEKEDGYYLYLSARFSEKEKPGVTYTDVDRYYVAVNVQYPDGPYAYLEDPDVAMLTYDDEFETLDGQNVGTVAQPRQLMLYARMGLNFMGYRSLLTGNVFETGDTIDVDKLPEAVYVGYELQEINDKEGYRISVYEVNDYVEPIFEYLGAVGGFLEPMYECTVNYYIPVEPKEDEGTTGDPLQFYSYAGSDVHTLAMFDLEMPMELTCQPDYMEDLGYVFDGYGALDDDEITYPDGIIFMDQYSSNDNAGNLSYAVKLFYTQADEDATEEELLDTAKGKISAKYQEILEDASASDAKKAIASDILAEIADAADREEMKEICRKGEESIRLQEAKDMAIADVMMLAPEGAVTDEMQAILDNAAADIQASENTENFENIISEARYEINRLNKESIVELEIISITEKSDAIVGELIDLEVLVSKPVKKVAFIDANGNTTTYTASSTNTVSVVNNDDGTQVWTVKLTVRHSVDEYTVKIKERSSGNWSDNTYDLKIEVPAPVVADEIISVEVPDEANDEIKYGTHDIVITTGKDVSRVQVAYAGTTATYSKSSTKATVVEDGDTLVWTISFNFYKVGSVDYAFASRASSGSWKTSDITETIETYKTKTVTPQEPV